MAGKYFPLLYFLLSFINLQSYSQIFEESLLTSYHLPSENIIAVSDDLNSSGSFYSIESGLQQLNNRTPIDFCYNAEVEKTIRYFLEKRRSDIELYLQRSRYFFPVIENILDKYDLPLELKYIAVIESGLNPFAKSSSGAAGIWQFLLNTCSLFDLQVDSYIDERRDLYKSTEAACRYLQYLYRTYNDWNLAMASYCNGPGDVRKAIERSGGKTDYWEIRPLLTEQARNYIPAFIAIGYVMNFYDRYGLHPNIKGYTWPDVDTLQIGYSVSFQQIASVLDITVSEIEWLNPVYRRDFIPDLQQPCTLILPKDLILDYLRNESRIISSTIPRNDYFSLLAVAGTTENRTMITHTVKCGEYLHKIALNYNCTIENIRAWNNLTSLDAYPGQILQIWIPQNSEY